MKRISSGTVTVFVLAIVVGLVAAFVVKQALKPAPEAPVAEAPKEPTIPVVVAARNLTENSVIRRGDVRIVQFNAKRKPTGTLRMVQVAEGRIIKEAVKAGRPIFDANLHGVGETLPGLASRIPPGMRAMPINVDEQSVVAKMVGIGSHVDIALSVEGTHPDLGGKATKTLLHRVEVIGVERPSSRRNANNKSTITVAVSPADANMLINAEGTGTLDLTLCSPLDDDTIPVSVGGEDNLMTRHKLLGLSPLPPPPVPPKPFIIEKWEGGGVKRIQISPERVEEAHRATASSKKFNADQSIPVKTAPSPVKTETVETSTISIEQIPVTTDVQQ